MPSATRPNRKLHVPAMTADDGSTSLGNWIWRMRPCRPVTDRVASLSVVVNHFHGRMAAKMNSGIVGRLPLEDDRDEDDVDGHLEQRIDDPPELAQYGVAMGPLDVRAHEIAREAAPAEQVGQPLPDQADGSGTLGAWALRGGRLGRRSGHGRP